jgi:hypothetical protein
MKTITRSRVARLVCCLVAAASLATGISFTQAAPASAAYTLGWPNWYPNGYAQCGIDLEVGDYYGYPYVITRDLYGGGPGWCAGGDPYRGNNHRFKVQLQFWLPGCGYNPYSCLVTYETAWVSGYQYQGTDTYIHMGVSYQAEPERACVVAQYWRQGFGWAYDTHGSCIYY